MQNDHSATQAGSATGAEMLAEAVDLGGGAAILLLPLLVTALPGVILLLILPAILIVAALAAPVAIAGILVAPPYFVLRSLAGGLHGRRGP